MFALRADKLKGGVKFAVISRESFLLANNVVFVVAAFSVMLGTLYPLLIDALGMGKISVGPPYFDAIFVPIMSPAIFLMGLAIFSRWKQTDLLDLAKKLKIAFGVSLISSVAIPFLFGKYTVMINLGLFMAFWIIATAVYSIYTRINFENKSIKIELQKLTKSYLGMIIAHVGVAIFIIGVTMVNGYQVETAVKMSIGDEVVLDQYVFKFAELQELEGANYVAAHAKFLVFKKNSAELFTMLEPEKRIYTVQNMPMTEAAIYAGLFKDLYISIGDQVADGSWVVRVYVKPFAHWIWAGCILMALGGLLGLLDKRYKKLAIRDSIRKEEELKQVEVNINEKSV